MSAIEFEGAVLFALCTRFALCFVLLHVLLLGAATAQTRLVFASYPSERPSEELLKLEPIRRLIEQGLKAGESPDYQLEMRIFTTYDEAIAAIGRGEVDFARLGPVSYIRAKRQNPALRLLAKESEGPSGFLKGYVFVAEDSPIQRLADLRGRRFAFGEPGSTTGAALAQAALVAAGVRARDLAAYQFLGRHDKVIYAVAAGAFDAGAANEVTFQKYAPGRALRAIHTLYAPAHAWVARKGLPPHLFSCLQQVLMALPAAELARLSRDRLMTAQDKDYDSLRQSMLQAERFTP